jgi:hypothetical protein
MSDSDAESCMLPPPLPDPSDARRRAAAHYGLAARTAHLVAHDAVRAFDTGDRARFLAALDALVELASEAHDRRQ